MYRINISSLRRWFEEITAGREGGDRLGMGESWPGDIYPVSESHLCEQNLLC